MDLLQFLLGSALQDGLRAVPVSGTEASLSPAAGNRYDCGSLASLTVTTPPARGAYCIIFSSGATPTYTSFPAAIKGLESFAAAADTRYEIHVLDGFAVWKGWPVGASA